VEKRTAQTVSLSVRVLRVLRERSAAQIFGAIVCFVAVYMVNNCIGAY